MYPIVNSCPAPVRHYPIAAVGEAPGREESVHGVPLVGPSGQEHRKLLQHFGMDPFDVWKSNVMREYKEGNPDPTPQDIARWTPVLEHELSTVRPRLILALGRFATEWFLGPIPFQYAMRSVNAVLHQGGCFDASVAYRANGAPVMPIIHPAAGLRDDKQRVLVAYGYEQASKAWRKIQAGEPVRALHGPWDWKARGGDYRWVRSGPGADGLPWTSPEKVLAELRAAKYIGLDTEGSARNPWSLQLSPRPGLSFVALAGTPECAWLVEQMNRYVCRRDPDAPLFVIHNALHDIAVAEEGGYETEQEETDVDTAPPIHDADGELDILGAASALNLRLNSAHVVDSMYALYLLRREPMGLKPASWRWRNACMLAYMQVIGRSGIQAQVDYLAQVAGRSWSEPERASYRSNSGRPESWRPTPLHKRASAMLARIDKGEDVNIAALWTKRESERYRRQVIAKLRGEVEEVLGPLPEPSLANVAPSDALWYAGGDPDMGLQVYHEVMPVLQEMDLVRTFERGRRVLPAAAEIQMRGMSVDRPYFVSLEQELTTSCDKIQDELAALMPAREHQEVKEYASGGNAERYFPGSSVLFGSFYASGEELRIDDDGEKGMVNRRLTRLDPTAKKPYRFVHSWTDAQSYFNPNSSADTLQLIVDVLHLAPLKESKKTGKPSTAKDSIGHLAYGKTSENKVVARLFELRHMAKMRQFADDVLTNTREDDPAPRMYEQVSMTRTESRRFTQGRLMTIPSRSKLGLRVRQGYNAPPGRVLVAADYSRVEPSLAAHLSRDPRMLAVCYDPKGDQYIDTAMGVWHTPKEQVTKQQRTIAKEIYLGAVLYRMGPAGLQANLRQRDDGNESYVDLSREECKLHINNVQGHYRTFFEWGDGLVAEACKLGYTREPQSGMYRFLPALYLADRSEWQGRRDFAEAERHVVNHAIQTLAQDLLQNSISWLHEQLREMREDGRLRPNQVILILQLHDELMVECDDDEWTVSFVKGLLTEAFTRHHELASLVPIRCEVVSGRNWRELKEAG